MEVIKNARPKKTKQKFVGTNFVNSIIKAMLQELWAFNMQKQRSNMNIFFKHKSNSKFKPQTLEMNVIVKTTTQTRFFIFLIPYNDLKPT